MKTRMQSKTQNNQENQGRAVANTSVKQAVTGDSSLQFVDNRPEAVTQRKLKVFAINVKHAKHLIQLSRIANNNPGAVTKSMQTLIPSSVVLQAKLPTVEEGSSKEDILSFIDLIRHEMERQNELAEPKSPAITRIKSAAKDLQKAEGQMQEAGISITIARLNRIVANLNKSIDQGFVADYDYANEERKMPEVELSPIPEPGSLGQEKTLSEAFRAPMFEKAKNIGLIDDPQIIYWLQPDYLANRGEAGIPETNCKGLIVELLAKDKAEEKHETDFIEGDVEVFQGVKIVDPNQETETGNPRIMREIDVLVVRVLEDGKMVPMEIIEAKKQGDKKPKGLATDLGAKVRDLGRVHDRGWRVITKNGDDITDNLVPGEVRGYTAGPSDEYDIPINGEMVEKLYEYINEYRYGLSNLWH